MASLVYFGSMNSELGRSNAFRRRSHREQTVEEIEDEMDAAIERLRAGLTEMRHQDDSFSTRLVRMRKDIEEVSTACWQQKVQKTCPIEKPEDCNSCPISEEANSYNTANVAPEKFIPLPSSFSAGALKLRRNQSPLLRLELDNQLHPLNATAQRQGSESPRLQSSLSPPSPAKLSQKRSSVGSVLFKMPINKQTSVRSLPCGQVPKSPNISVHVTGSTLDRKSEEPASRRGSLSSWLLKKLQHN
ncbi:uncharacterized protein LOC134182081 [Corticium candelabrum]|uniref:uncharacterized protein LOC134182081 n=1 Tax=Corticium candelabrum TaxID=121492 RepID=UPI002E270306|nr:uncharacterized protein LOC134182081 [Corticium candelabrum]